MDVAELKEYFEKMLEERTKQASDAKDALKALLDERFRGEALAREKFEQKVEHKFTEVNMIREQISSERDQFASKEYVEENFKSIRSDNKKMSDQLSKQETNKAYLVGYVAGIVVLVAAAAFVVINLIK